MHVPFLSRRAEAVPSRVVRAANGRDVSVYEFGDPNGSPVFALHGTPACGAGFDWTDAPARERGLRVIAPDRPGIGRSDAAPMTSVADYAPEFGALADALGVDRFSLLGYSGGGPYALAVASAFAPRVRALGLAAGAGEIGTWATLDDLAKGDRQLTQLALRSPPAARVMLRVADLGARVSPSMAQRSATAEMTDSDRNVMRSLGEPRATMALFTQAMTRTTAGVVLDYTLLAKPWHVAFEQITAPVHCWHGTADTLVPLAHTTALMERVPNAELTTWPGEGHLALITHIAEVLDDIVAAPA